MPRQEAERRPLGQHGRAELGVATRKRRSDLPRTSLLAINFTLKQKILVLSDGPIDRRGEVSRVVGTPRASSARRVERG